MSDNTAAPREAPGSEELSWNSLRRTARASVGIAVLIVVALLVLPQMRDILAGFSDNSRSGLPARISYHFSLLFLAFSAWFWSRTVLSARFRVQDDRTSRELLRGGMTSRKGYRIDPRVFDFLPRALFLGIAFGGVVAAVNSSDLVDAGITVAWSAGGYALLQNRLAIRSWFRSPPTGRDDGAPSDPQSRDPSGGEEAAEAEIRRELMDQIFADVDRHVIPR